MPTERFLRLPEKKKEMIRMAAVKEFKRASMEGASINKIIQSAEISRGSFYTYFDDKVDLLIWLLGNSVRKHFNFYIQTLEENGGDIWEVFDAAFDHSIRLVEADGVLEVVENLVKSNAFADIYRKKMTEDEGFFNESVGFLKWVYGHVEKSVCPVDVETLYDVMEMHMIILVTSLKRLFAGQDSMESIRGYYKRRMRLLRYGVQNMPETRQKERQEENHEESRKGTDWPCGSGSSWNFCGDAAIEAGGTH